jgi:hypothetical protein
MNTTTPRRELFVSIGGLVGRLSLEHPTDELMGDLAHRYQGFLLPGPPEVEPAFSLLVSLQAQRVLPGWPDDVVRADVRTTATAIAIERWDFQARLERAGEGGPFVGAARCQARWVAIESLLRVSWSVLLPRAGGGLFHGCSFCDGVRAWLALGRSGAGKTTLARKVQGHHRLLGDEAVVVRRAPGGGWRASATPFYGALDQLGAPAGSWPLAGIAFLAKRAALEVSRPSPGDAVLRAIECLMCFETDLATADRNLELVTALCAEVPTFVSGGRADTPLPSLLAAWAPFAARATAAAPRWAGART